VTYDDRETTLHHFDFDGVEIATSRPELLAACVAVAVHPGDERYRGLEGRKLRVPFFGHQVPVIRDESVDPSFGTGAVMICTFGDKQDVHWWKQHNLPLRKAIDRQGRMTGIAGKYEGKRVEEARAAIVGDMKDQGILKDQHPLEQRVGTCWRCKTPIEILSGRQWFVRVKPDEILKAAREVTWIPEHMFIRLENWVTQMEWDWCISRQRIFATPIPAWSCRKCHAIILPKEEDLPVDPTREQPKEPCPSCGARDTAVGEEDVLDTWMDSSISVLHVTGWDGTGNPPLFPAQLRPQGHDIIRTWACYTILRSVALTGGKPWDAILVNGMVLGEDGFKMSKSRGNIIAPEEILVKYGADAFRQWGAAGAATGSDIMFNWNDVIAASRFQTKLWNIARFALLQLDDSARSDATPVTALADRWLLTRLSATVAEVTQAMEEYQFDRALRAIREFSWNVLADEYIELVKGRLYTKGEGRAGAARALAVTLDALCRLLAPFLPHFAEEVYHILAPADGSIHLSTWAGLSFSDPIAVQDGERLVRLVSELRRYKHEQGLALNAPFGSLTIYGPHPLDDAGDLGRALNATVEWRTEAPRLERVVKEVRFQRAIIGPALRKQAGAFMEAVKALPPDQLEDPPVTVRIGGEEVPVPPGSFSPVFSYRIGGAAVDVITIGDAVVAIRRAP